MLAPALLVQGSYVGFAPPKIGAGKSPMHQPNLASTWSFSGKGGRIKVNRMGWGEGENGGRAALLVGRPKERGGARMWNPDSGHCISRHRSKQPHSGSWCLTQSKEANVPLPCGGSSGLPT